MKRLLMYLVICCMAFLIASCNNQSKIKMEQPKSSWEQTLKELLPLLGHRNWIVITDMAYPLQSAQGITTLYADEDFNTVLTKVKHEIDSMPHVFAHVYHDQEMDVLNDSLAPGIDKVKATVTKLYGKEAKSMPHETIIEKLDKASRLYSIVIIKTPLTIPYTSIFLELDCKYWDAARQAKLDDLMLKL